jgi:hypothetical protein
MNREAIWEERAGRDFEAQFRGTDNRARTPSSRTVPCPEGSPCPQCNHPPVVHEGRDEHAFETYMVACGLGHVEGDVCISRASAVRSWSKRLTDGRARVA